VAAKVTVGLASHWPCVTNLVVYPPRGSTANEREMSTLPTGHNLFNKSRTIGDYFSKLITGQMPFSLFT